jgi:hypothetical protein
MRNDFEHKSVLMDGVTEHNEGLPVRLEYFAYSHPGPVRAVIKALNEGGCNSTEVDLLDVLSWVKANRPELLKDDGL